MQIDYPYIPSFIIQQYQQKCFQGRLKAAVLFADISGFTSLTESLLNYGKKGSDTLYLTVQQVFNPMIELVYNHHGFVATFQGDSLTAVFPYFNNTKENIKLHAKLAANLILHHFNNHPVIRTSLGEFKFQVKLGGASGKINWGIVGKVNLKNYYFKGPAIDRAAQLEKQAEAGVVVWDKFLKDIPEYKPTDLSDNPYIEKPKLKRILEKFFNDRLINYHRGEIRQVVTVFISFDKLNQHSLIDSLYQNSLKLVDHYGGFFSRISFGDKGARFLIFFGFPVAHEDDLRRAVMFCLDWSTIPQLVNLNISWNIGLTKGTVYAGESGGSRRAELTCQGDSVNLSARLANLDKQNKIICPGDILEQCSDYANFQYLGKKRFKGKAEPISCYWISHILKNHNHHGDISRNIWGRESEISTITQHLKTTILNNKPGGLLSIYGNPGIGKSRLIQYILSYFNYNNIDHLVIYIQGDNLIDQSYQGIIKFFNDFFNLGSVPKERKLEIFLNNFNQLIQQLQTAKLKKNLIRVKSFLASLVDVHWNNSLYSQLEPKLRSKNQVQSIKLFIQAISTLRPVLIIFEDSQWIDQATLELLPELVSDNLNYPYVIIMTSRYQENNLKPQYLPLNFTSTIELELSPLPPGMEKNFIHEYFGNFEIDRNLIQLLEQKCKGNPFHLNQWLIHLDDLNLIIQSDQKITLTTVPEDLPANIEQLVISQIDKLNNHLKEVVLKASIIGVRFATGILSKMLADQDIIYLLDQVTKKGIFFPETSSVNITELYYLFTHLIIREVAYQMQLDSDRKEMHKLIFEILENFHQQDIYLFYEELYYHACNAGLKKQHIYYLKKSAELDRKNYHLSTSLKKYINLYKLLSDDKSRYDIAMTIADIYEKTGPFEKGQQYSQIALVLAKKMKRKSDQQKAKLSLAKFLGLQGKNLIGLSLAKNVLKYLEQKDQLLLKVSTLRTLAFLEVNMSDFDQALEYLHQAELLMKNHEDQTGYQEICKNIYKIYTVMKKFELSQQYLNKCYLKTRDQLNNIQQQQRFFKLQGDVCFQQQNYDQALNYYKKSQQIANKIGDQAEYASGFNDLGIAYLFLNDNKNAVKNFQQCIDHFTQLGDIRMVGRASYNLATVYENQMDFARAEKYYLKYREIAARINSDGAQITSLLNLYSLAVDQQKWSDGLKYCDQLEMINQRHQDLPLNARIISYRAEIYKNLNQEEMVKKCLVDMKKIQYSNLKGIDLFEINLHQSSLFLTCGEVDKAYHCIINCSEFDWKTLHSHYTSQYLYNACIIHVLKSKFKDAEIYLNQLVSIYNVDKQPFLKAEIYYEYVSSVFKMKSDKHKSYPQKETLTLYLNQALKIYIKAKCNFRISETKKLLKIISSN